MFCTDSASLSAAPAAHDLVHRLRELLPEALDLERVRSLRRVMKGSIQSTTLGAEYNVLSITTTTTTVGRYRVIVMLFDIIFLDYL